MLGVGRHGPLGMGAASADRVLTAGGATAAPVPPPSPPTRAPAAGPVIRWMAESESRALAVLSGVGGLGPVGLAALRDRAGSARAILEIAAGRDGRADLIALGGGGDGRSLTGTVAAGIVEAARSGPLALARIDELGLAIVTVDDPTYPERLRRIELPPHVLLVAGDPAALTRPRAVAVVGTRRPTELGRRIATRIATALALADAAVISGLAVGIDGVAHDTAVREGVPTIAVIGSGHDRLYPQAHAPLAARIVRSGGAVISEFPPTTRANQGTFPRRNRLISGLADATVVVEAGRRSGALITASWAIQQGRECFIVPGALDAPASAGCVTFLREAHGEARIVAGVGELIEDLGFTNDSEGPVLRSMTASLAEIGGVEREVAVQLAAGRATVDDLVAATGHPTATVLGALTLLELRGLAASAYGRYRPAGLLARSEAAPAGRRRRG